MHLIPYLLPAISILAYLYYRYRKEEKHRINTENFKNSFRRFRFDKQFVQIPKYVIITAEGHEHIDLSVCIRHNIVDFAIIPIPGSDVYRYPEGVYKFKATLVCPRKAIRCVSDVELQLIGKKLYYIKLKSALLNINTQMDGLAWVNEKCYTNGANTSISPRKPSQTN